MNFPKTLSKQITLGTFLTIHDTRLITNNQSSVPTLMINEMPHPENKRFLKFMWPVNLQHGRHEQGGAQLSSLI